tara:strand:- start:651 stop:1670 length:1020 start_codon:yes stop_codon:yes gene_type:complete
MKKLLSILFLFSFCFGFAQTKDSLSVEEQQRREKNIQAGNPFKKFGYTPKIHTLSKGKYLEFHDLDSIVKIGSFSYHVKNKSITGYSEKETKYSEATLRPEIVSRWFSPDPLSNEFPNWSPYTFTNDNPIYFVDPDGRFSLPAALAKKYQRLAHYLKNNIQSISNNKTVMGALMKYGQFTEEQINNALKWGEGPEINITQLGPSSTGIGDRAGLYAPKKYGKNTLNLDSDLADRLENATGDNKDILLFQVAKTILHEYVHLGDAKDGVQQKDNSGKIIEEGNAFEIKAYGRDIRSFNDAADVLNEYNKRNGISKRYEYSEQKEIQLEEVIITTKKKIDD